MQSLVEATQSSSIWFSKPRSTCFLMATNIMADSVFENRLRLLSDYILSKFVPQNEKQLLDHLRIINIFVEQHPGNHAYFPSGPVTLLSLVLSNNLPFKPSQKLSSASLRMFSALHSFPSFESIFPELSTLLPDSLKKLHEFATISMQKRSSEYSTRIIWPPMIQQVDPVLTPRELSEEQKLRKQRRKEQSKTKRLMQKENELFRIRKFEEFKQKKLSREKYSSEMRAMMERERTYDLNMAAANKEDFIDEDKSEEEDIENLENIENISTEKQNDDSDNFHGMSKAEYKAMMGDVEEDSDESEDEDENEDEDE